MPYVRAIIYTLWWNATSHYYFLIMIWGGIFVICGIVIMHLSNVTLFHNLFIIFELIHNIVIFHLKKKCWQQNYFGSKFWFPDFSKYCMFIIKILWTATRQLRNVWWLILSSNLFGLLCPLKDHVLCDMCDMLEEHAFFLYT